MSFNVGSPLEIFQDPYYHLTMFLFLWTTGATKAGPSHKPLQFFLEPVYSQFGGGRSHSGIGVIQKSSSFKAHAVAEMT